MEKKILVVDDEEQILELMKRMFSEEGYTVFAAACAEEALKILEENDIPVIFLDLMLPDINGVELCGKIKSSQEQAHINVYAVTGYSSMLDDQKDEDTGFDDCFYKPLNRDALLGAAKNAFAKIERQQNT